MKNTFHNLLSFCDVQTFRAGGKGGQHQNKTESAVRLVHRPTGITVVCRDERSQHLNRLRCLALLQRKLARLREKSKARTPTVVPHLQKVGRLEKKRLLSRKKTLRKRPSIDE